jgi:hypothetical protein
MVTLEGAITDDRLRDGLRVLAENTPGVTKVRDRIAWIEPNSGCLVPPADAPGDLTELTDGGDVPPGVR